MCNLNIFLDRYIYIYIYIYVIGVVLNQFRKKIYVLDLFFPFVIDSTIPQINK
jgi:hypothetical protein